jgi:hypothetical protein
MEDMLEAGGRDDEDVEGFKTFLGFVKNRTVMEAIFGYVQDARDDQYVITSPKEGDESGEVQLRYKKNSTPRRFIRANSPFDKYRDMGEEMKKLIKNEYVFDYLAKMSLRTMVSFQTIGIPEMDTMGEIEHRHIDLRVHDPSKERVLGRQFFNPMLTGMYRPLSISHTISPKGYFTNFTGIRRVGSYSPAVVDYMGDPPPPPSLLEATAEVGIMGLKYYFLQDD